MAARPIRVVVAGPVSVVLDGADAVSVAYTLRSLCMMGNVPELSVRQRIIRVADQILAAAAAEASAAEPLAAQMPDDGWDSYAASRALLTDKSGASGGTPRSPAPRRDDCGAILRKREAS